jgi:hypothetical protein
VLPSTFIGSEKESRFALNGWIDLRIQYWKSKQCGVTYFYFWKDARVRNGNGYGRTETVGEVVHVCRERKGASNSEEKKRMGNNVMILGRHRVWSGSKALLSFWSGSGQARFIFQAREHGGSCELRDKDSRERFGREMGKREWGSVGEEGVGVGYC